MAGPQTRYSVCSPSQAHRAPEPLDMHQVGKLFLPGGVPLPAGPYATVSAVSQEFSSMVSRKIP